MITPLISSNIWALYLSVLQFTDFDYSYGICKRLSIELSVPRFTAFYFLFGMFKPLAIMLSVLHRFTASYFLFDMFKPLNIVLSILRYWDSVIGEGLRGNKKMK